MKRILKGERNSILLLILLGLMFILWARVITFEIKRGTVIQDIDTTLKRVKCVESFGWVVDPGSEKHQKIKIPQEFTDVFENYNQLQKQSGFNLSDYRGKTVSKYTYIILNPPENSKDVFYVNILVYENKMIGADVMTPSLNGVMLPITRGK